jgi:hypothetical protein
MQIQKIILFLLLVPILFATCRKEDPAPVPDILQLISIKAGPTTLQADGSSSDIPMNSTFTLQFSKAIDTAAIQNKIWLLHDQKVVPVDFNFNEQLTIIEFTPDQNLEWLTSYTLSIDKSLTGALGETFPGLDLDFTTEKGKLLMESVMINSLPFDKPFSPKGIDIAQLTIEINFNEKLTEADIDQHFTLLPAVPISVSLSESGKTVTITNTEKLDYYRKYGFLIRTDLSSEDGLGFDGFNNFFVTGLDSSYKHPEINDEDLLDLVQLHTFRYFWDYAHPVSGLTRERLGSGELVTSGGSGFGLMAVIIGAERGFISREEAVDHFEKVTNFLSTADRFHGAWSHWLNGSTGRAIAFSTKDDGGDLVETSFLAAGLLTVRQYLDPSQSNEQDIIDNINQMLDEIEWDWFTRGGQQVLYWHWSPNYGWDMNMQIRGYNEALITYFMAAMSTTHPVDADVYHNGWARSGAIVNGNSFYGIQLPVGYNYGGPLFFSHYSFLGLNPQNLTDQYADYWEQNRNHSLINYQHNVLNPKQHLGYSADCWGLTASDEPGGYGVHEPIRDNGTITPSAALSSMPYTPEESMQALRHFYYILGDKLWGTYGFHDAFNPGEAWWADSYLAIDQGPIIVMIENHRSGLCWDLFMSAPEVETTMDKLGFSR